MTIRKNRTHTKKGKEQTEDLYKKVVLEGVPYPGQGMFSSDPNPKSLTERLVRKRTLFARTDSLSL